MAIPSDRPRVLVTGTQGFTGHYVLEALAAAGFDGVDPKQIDVDFNLTQPERLPAMVAAANCRFAIHLAAISFVGHGDPADFYRVNTVGTENLLAALSGQGGYEKVIVASSANIYGNQASDDLDETTPPAPVNHYGASKIAMEYIARQAFDALPIILTRPFNYTGRGQSDSFLIPKIVAHFRSRAPRLELGNRDVVRDFSDVRDVAAAIVRLLGTEARGVTVNICSGVGHSLQWVIDECRTITGHDIEVVTNPAFVRANEIKSLIGSNARLAALAGPLHPIPLGDTLRWMLS